MSVKSLTEGTMMTRDSDFSSISWYSIIMVVHIWFTTKLWG